MNGQIKNPLAQNLIPSSEEAFTDEYSFFNFERFIAPRNISKTKNNKAKFSAFIDAAISALDN